ncbi:MAG: hypothetical protein U9R42_10140 [Bacteroidota bacterium]|nr:hypothetical protein [Bacteroidota bacterium]
MKNLVLTSMICISIAYSSYSQCLECNTLGFSVISETIYEINDTIDISYLVKKNQ